MWHDVIILLKLSTSENCRMLYVIVVINYLVLSEQI